MRKLRLILGLSIGLLAATAAPAAASDCPNADIPSVGLTEVQIEDSLQCLINARRQGAGLAGVRPEGRLRAAAERHSQDMVSGGFFGHDNPSGVGFIDRIVATGYTRGSASWLVGENLVWGTDELSAPASMVQAWMDSPSHRANLMRPSFRELGLSAVRGTPYDANESNGITVTSEYGVRKPRKKSRKGARTARKRAARRQRRR